MTALVRAMRTPMPPALRFGMPRDRLDELRALIAQLFGNGEQGAMYIPQPQVLGQQVLFQDAAGTTPVTADGDPVGYVADLSGNGNHATQSISAARPLYRTDGTLHWLEFDEVDDFLNLNIGNLGGSQWSLRYSATPSLPSKGVVFLSNLGSSLPWIGAAYENSTSTSQEGSGATLLDMLADGLSLGRPLTRRALWNALMQAHVYGADFSTIGWPNPIIGEYSDNSASFGHNMHAVILRQNILSAKENAALDTYLASLAGVTL